MMKQAKLTFREIAAELGIHEDNVEWRYYRGKRDFERRFPGQRQELTGTGDQAEKNIAPRDSLSSCQRVPTGRALLLVLPTEGT